jgi:hypothetical protein
MTGLDRIVVLALGLAAASAGLAMRAAPSLRLLRVGQEQVGQQGEDLLTRIVQKADRFDKSLDPSGDRDGIDNTRGHDEIRQAVNDFRQAAVWLRDRASDRHTRALDVEEVLRCGAGIDGLTQRHQLSVPAKQAWLSLRADLGRLARAYAVARNRSEVQASGPAVLTLDGPPRHSGDSR